MTHKSKKARRAYPGGTVSSTGNVVITSKADISDSLRHLNKIRIAAYWGIWAVFIVIACFNDFRHWVRPGAWRDRWLFADGAILIVTLAGLAICWILATDHEIKLWLRWLDNPVQKRTVYVAISALSITLGMCLAYFYNIVVISFIFTLYLLLNYWSQWLSTEHFQSALAATRKRLQDKSQRDLNRDNNRNVLTVLEHYWLTQPQLARITTMMFASSVAFSFAFADWVQKPAGTGTLQFVGFTLLILNIVIGEAIIGAWRYNREQDIQRVQRGEKPSFLRSIKPPLAGQEEIADIKGYATGGHYGIFGAALGVVALIVLVDQTNDVKPPLLHFPSSGGHDAWMFAGNAVLLVTFIALSFRWLSATEKELRLWVNWLKNPVTKAEAKIAILSLSLVLGTIIALAIVTPIVIIAGFMTLYFVVNYWTQQMSNEHFEQALARTREDISQEKDEEKERVLLVLEEYWVHRPQLARITTMLFFSSMAYSLAFTGFMKGGEEKDWFYVASYCMLFLVLVTGEYVIFKWRQRRDRDLVKLQLGEG